jgi:hypothetical protein
MRRWNLKMKKKLFLTFQLAFEILKQPALSINQLTFLLGGSYVVLALTTRHLICTCRSSPAAGVALDLI